MKLYEYLDTKYTKHEQLNLKNLYCSHNQITSLEGIENLTYLKYLSCHNTQLTTLIEIEKLTLLEYLNCSNNQLTSLEGIENLTKLECLYCSNNKLSYKSNILEDVLKEVKIEKRKTLIKTLLSI